MVEWDEAKRLWTIEARGLDFRDAVMMFDGRPAIHAIGHRGGEERLASVAMINGKCFTVIWTWRGRNRRIISFRRSQDGEERRYHARHG